MFLLVLSFESFLMKTSRLCLLASASFASFALLFSLSSCHKHSRSYPAALGAEDEQTESSDPTDDNPSFPQGAKFLLPDHVSVATCTIQGDGVTITLQLSDVYCEAPLWMARMSGRITFRDWNAFGEMAGQSYDILPSRIEQSGSSGIELRSEAEGGHETGAVELEGMQVHYDELGNTKRCGRILDISFFTLYLNTEGMGGMQQLESYHIEQYLRGATIIVEFSK